MPTMSNSLHEQPEDLFDLRRRDAVSPRQAAEWIPDLFDSQSLAGVSAASFSPHPSRNSGGGDRQELSGAGAGIFHQNKVIIEKSISLAAHDSRGERKGTLRPNHPPAPLPDRVGHFSKNKPDDRENGGIFRKIPQ